MNAARVEARLAGYFETIVERAGGTELERAVARVVASCFRNGPDVQVSAEHVRKRCADRGVKAGRAWSSAPSYGTVTRVLEILRAQAVTWAKAHVARWHGPLPPDPAGWPRLRPRRHADGSFRLPARKLRLIGFAATLAALVAASIEPDPEAEGGRAAVRHVQPPSVSSRAALQADAATLEGDGLSRSIADALARVKAWSPPGDG